MTALPRGFASASADKDVKFWDFTVETGGVLGIALARQLTMAQDALCVRYSPTRSQDKLLVAIGLLDCTVKVFFDDSLKFFLSLYGHQVIPFRQFLGLMNYMYPFPFLNYFLSLYGHQVTLFFVL